MKFSMTDLLVDQPPIVAKAKLETEQEINGRARVIYQWVTMYTKSKPAYIPQPLWRWMLNRTVEVEVGNFEAVRVK